MSFISVKNLKYRYPQEKNLALNDLSFDIEKGEFIGILGANGAGKSSLSQALLGLIPQFYKGAYGGEVWVDGLNAASTPIGELCKKAGLIFQNPFNQLSGAKDTVFDEVAYGLQNLGVPKDEIFLRVENILKKLEIWEYRDRNPFDLSGGQLQRVAIASILAMEPEILILDEPTSQLDPAGSEEVFHTVEKLKESGITILMIEQKMEKLADYCDRILLMQEGRLIDFDTPDKIFSRDDLSQYGIEPPYSVTLAKALGLHMENGCYPLNAKSLLSILTEDKRGLAKELLMKDLSAVNGTGNLEELRDFENDALFKVKGLQFSYDKVTPILKNLDLTLDHRPTAIVGQNGAGKTTLVRLIKGLLKPDQGELLFQNEDLSKKTVAELAGKVGYVFQNPDDQIFKYNVLEEVLFGPLNIGMDRQEAEKKAREALSLVGLEDAADQNPYDLDLSERKLVAIASVLAMDTEVLILDEPTIAQDAKGKQILKRIIEEESKKGKLVIAILHDMEFVLHSFERVIAMSKGQILKDDTPLSVFQDKEVLKKAALLPPAEVELYGSL